MSSPVSSPDHEAAMRSSPVMPSSPGIASSPVMPDSSLGAMGGNLASSPIHMAGTSSPIHISDGLESSSSRTSGSRTRRHHRSDIGWSEGSTPNSFFEYEEGPRRFIWGTTVAIQELTRTFKQFIEEFHPPGEPHNLVYMTMIRRMRQAGTESLNLDLQNLKEENGQQPWNKLYYQIRDYPHEAIPLMDQSLKEIIVAQAQGEAGDRGSRELEEIDSKHYRVRPYNIRNDYDGKIRDLRALNPSDMDKLVTIKGLTLRASDIIPDMTEAFFRCNVCNSVKTVKIDRGVIVEPTQCERPSCGAKSSMILVHNRCEFSDKQIIRLQETPDAIPDGQTPHSVALAVYDELVDYTKAGDRIMVTGVFRGTPVRVNPRQRALKSLFKTYVDVVHIQKVDRRRMDFDTSTLAQEMGEQQNREQSQLEELRSLSAEDVARIHAIAARPDVYELLSRSLAPSIFEHDDVKKGILLQLFGGTNKTFTKGGSPRYRGDINILLCGDPSTSKSQLLQYVHKIAPRGMYTSGKGSSAVGLTAYITRDPDSRQIVLESGALVLSDGGVCCIDEFDKMNDATRSVLHEVMEQQTVSIAKAGIITTLNARTSILASANPIESHYRPDLSVTQNIDLPPTLLSRFDLVYLMIDKINQNQDRKLASHLASMYLEDRPENAARDEILDTETLTMYLSYAREHCTPVITPQARRRIVDEYVQMRLLGDSSSRSGKRITATTRQLESIIRLSEAHAKMRLSEEVSEEDALEAVRLIREAVKEYATDPSTGRIDMDLVQTGVSRTERDLMERIKEKALSLLDQQTVAHDELVARVLETSITTSRQSVKNALDELQSSGTIVVSGPRRMTSKAT